MKKRNIFRIVWFSLVTLFFIWQWTTYQSRSLPPNTFENDDRVSVEITNDKIVFRPTTSNYNHQIIFFQGGLTDPKAYAPLCRKIAEGGFICHLIKMDWRMPKWDYQKIKTMFNLERGNYILGGHSQGAKMASQFVFENPKVIKGLYLLGTSHPRDFSLSKRNLPVIKIYGARDGLASVPEVMENKEKLPETTQWIEIKGGNHSQFGFLGKLLTDDDPEITLEEQQKITGETLISFFKKIENQTSYPE